MRALFVENPNARSGDSEPATRELSSCLDRLRDSGWAIETISAPSRKAAIDELQERAPRFDLVLVAGGDGSLNTAIQVAGRCQLAVGLLPMGTANDFARTANIPEDLERATELLLSGSSHKIDLGEVNGHLFVNALGFGLGTYVTKELDSETKARWGVFGYPIALYQAWNKMRPFRAHVEGDFPPLRRSCLQITIANCPYFGGGMMIDQSSAPDDGLFDLQAIAPVPWQKLLLEAKRLREGRGWESDVACVQSASAFRIRTSRPFEVSVDGELLTSTPIHCVKRHLALEVVGARPTESDADQPQSRGSTTPSQDAAL